MVSVIIPVYNAEKYLEHAVLSAEKNKYVSEIILIDDKSPDNSIDICFKLKNKFPNKVHVLVNKENVGAGESRNIGILAATSKYIAFLDADDFFNLERFDRSIPMLEQDVSIDGIYEAIGVKYTDDKSKIQHLERMERAKANIVNPALQIDFTGIEKDLNPEDLFYHLLKSDYGWIHLNGLTLRSSSLNHVKLFSNQRIAQDSEFITRISRTLNLLGTKDFTPVAFRRVHPDNRILKYKKNPNDKDSHRKWIYFLLHTKSHFGKDKKSLIYLVLRATDSANKFEKIFKMLRIFLTEPKIIFYLIF